MELSEKEKRAIDNMKSLLLYSKKHEYFSPFQEQEIDDMDIVLNIVEKQQKEITKEHQNWKDLLFEYGKKCEELNNSISKDKIREKIEHYNDELEHIKNGEEFENEKPMYYWGKAALEELL